MTISLPTGKIVVSGSSTGAIGGSFYPGLVAEHYPDNPVVLFADGTGGYSSPMVYHVFEAWDMAGILPDWSEYSWKSNQSLSFQDFYTASANHNDNLIIAQYNTLEDVVQYNLTCLLDDPKGRFTLPQRFLTNYLDIAQNVEQFADYTAGGSVYTITGSDIFYEYSVEDVRFVDWLNELVSRISVANVSCVNEARGCSNAPN